MNPVVEVVTGASPAWWITALQSLSGVIVGGMLTVGGQRLSDKRSERREAAKIASELELQDDRAWKQLQLESLVSLQSRLDELVRAYTHGIVLGSRAEGVFERIETLSAELMVYTSRLDDQQLASDVGNFSSDLGDRAKTALENTPLTQEEYSREYYRRWVNLNDRLGLAIRKNSTRRGTVPAPHPELPAGRKETSAP